MIHRQRKNDTGIDPITAQAENETDNTGEAVFVNADTENADTYFVQAKLDQRTIKSKTKGYAYRDDKQQ